MKKTEYFSLFAIFFSVLLFFNGFFLHGRFSIPSDTIVGLYHPFRDLYAMTNPRGIPFKNSLITDPVRQLYPWRYLAFSLEKKGQLPLWNPYSFSGTPLLANAQSAALYPLNIIFIFLPFNYGWTVLVMLAPLLSGIFLYLYLRHMRVGIFGSMFGALAFSFSGFSMSWLEWNTLGHVLLWLPLILLATEHLLKQVSVKWLVILLFAEVSQVLAGHVQALFYSLILSSSYLLARIYSEGKKEKRANKLLKHLALFVFLGVLVAGVTFPQWFSTMQLIHLSAREVDQADWQIAGWFLPWQHLVQFIAPDFFGNPTTGNYWGIWNYGEFAGYIGMAPLLFALFSLFYRRDKKTYFFATAFFSSLVLALPTFLAKIPFQLHFPILSSAQPSRLLGIADFSLAVLAGLGVDSFFHEKKKTIFLPIAIIGVLLLTLWVFSFAGSRVFSDIAVENFLTARRNLTIPTGLLLVSALIIAFSLFAKKNKTASHGAFVFLALLLIFDLVRFGLKFNPFTDPSYLFPDTKVTLFLQQQKDQFRIMSSDSRIFPPNFSVFYNIQSIEGYDPLYLLRYGELIAASERGKPEISAPFGFNRIITPHNFDSKIADLLGVKYVLSLNDLSSQKLVKVFEEGQTRVYENKNVLPRAFFVEDLHQIFNTNKEEAIKIMFDKKIDLRTTAVIEGLDPGGLKITRKLSKGEAKIIQYGENRVMIRTNNNGEGLLVLTDSYYPTWRVKIYPYDSAMSPAIKNDISDSKIYITDYNFRGVFVPEGENTVVFYNTLFPSLFED